MADKLDIYQGYGDSFKNFESNWILKSSNTIIGIDRDFKIVLLNPAYFKFAAENKGEKIPRDYGLGKNMLAGISGPQRKFYHELMLSCFDRDEHISHEYECCSTKVHRLFRLFVYPVKNNSVLLLDHSLLIEKEQKLQSAEMASEEYIDKNGYMHQCGHCRRVRHNNSLQWDWLELSLTFPFVSHGLCQSCYSTYYSELFEE